MKLVTSLFILIIISSIGYSQIRDNEFDLENFIESNFPIQDQDINYEDIYESLFLLCQTPINLNKAGRQELQSVLILSNLQINKFLEYREKNGKFLSIYELQAVPEFDLNTINQILPFIMVRESGLQTDNRPLLKRIFTEENNYLIFRADRVLETKKGYKSTEERARQYLGDPNRIYTRFRVSHTNDFSIGFTAEKDAGEQLNWNPERSQYGMDFYSFHFQLQNQGKLKNILLGDYQLQYGQSLLFGAGFAIGKGSETVATARRSNTGVMPYTSVLETNFFRGIAATYELTKRLDFTTFYSINPVNASTAIDSVESVEEYFTAIRLNGFHRTASELSAKSAILSQNFGGTFLFHSRSENLNIGINYIHTLYDRNFNRRPNKYNQFEFSGRINQNYGAFANYYWRNFHLFGESAISRSGGIGAIAGFVTSISSNIQMSLILRNFERDFHSFYGTAFGENTRNINEKGVYWGIKFQPYKKLYLSAFYDKFQFPWLKFRADAPSQGNEYLGRVSYSFTRNIHLYGQLRVENKERNTSKSDNSNLNSLENGQKRNYLLNLDIRPKGIISLKSRLQFSEFLFNGAYTNGMALIQDVNFDFGKLRLSTRYAIFDTDDFENRQYAYERDVLYAFSIPAYQNTGTRTYAVIQYKFNKKFQIWARWSQFNFLDQITIGSGNEQIEGNRRSEVKLQMMYKL